MQNNRNHLLCSHAAVCRDWGRLAVGLCSMAWDGVAQASSTPAKVLLLRGGQPAAADSARSEAGFPE